MTLETYLGTAGKKFRAIMLAAGLAAFGAFGAAQALDFNDVRNLMANHVPENVIINMVQQDPNLAITAEQADQLRGLGASESLILSIRSTQITAQTTAGGYPAATTYQTIPAPQMTTHPATTYPTTTYPADAGIYAGYGDYDYDAQDGDYDDFEGEYYQQQQYAQQYPATGTVGTTVSNYGSYVEPAPIYTQPAPVVVQTQPTVIYETAPTYVYPSTPAYDYTYYFGSGPRRRPPPPPAFRPPHRPGPGPIHRPGGHGPSKPGGPGGKPGGPGGPGKPPFPPRPGGR